MTSRLALFAICLSLCVGCRTESQRTPRPAAASKPAPRPAPGEEPLETADIGNDEVQTLPAERAPAAAVLGACSWSSVWQKDDVPNPVLAGTNGLPMPVKTSHRDLIIAGARPSETAEIHAEIVIGPFGAVLEATIVHAAEPRWPEAEEAIVATLREWRYEPQTLGGKPVTVCSTLVMKP